MGHALTENRNGLIVGAATTRTSGYAERLAALALIENRNGLIVGAATTRTSGYAERLAALALIEPHAGGRATVSIARWII